MTRHLFIKTTTSVWWLGGGLVSLRPLLPFSSIYCGLLSLRALQTHPTGSTSGSKFSRPLSRRDVASKLANNVNRLSCFFFRGRVCCWLNSTGNSSRHTLHSFTPHFARHTLHSFHPECFCRTRPLGKVSFSPSPEVAVVYKKWFINVLPFMFSPRCFGELLFRNVLFCD